MERAKRSGGLHKRSAEDWGRGLRARGAGPLSWLFKGRRCGQDRPEWRVAMTAAGRSQGGDFLPLNRPEEKDAVPPAGS